MLRRVPGLWNDQARWGAGCSFLDYNRDGNLDLFVSNYVRFSLEHAPVPGENPNCNWKGVPVECGPRGLPTGLHSLYRNNGDGTFTDVSKQAGIASATECYGMTVVAADLDEDGWTDIFVACDSTPSLLFMNNHDGTFREEGVVRGVALSDDGMEQAGMGVGVGDYDLDGHLDLFKTHFADDANGLYHNDGKGNFDDVTRSSPPGGRDPLYLLGRRHGRSRQRWEPRYFHGYRQRVSRNRAQVATICEQKSTGAVSQPG